MDYQSIDFGVPPSYTPLPPTNNPTAASSGVSSSRGRRNSVVAIFAVSLLIFALVAIIVKPPIPTNDPSPSSAPEILSSMPATQYVSRGVREGVSDKSSGALQVEDGSGPAWTNQMLTWQRSSYHFQPEKNWMNDPNGVMHYKGWYHLFYQYNPDSAVWGNITWGHAVSRDLIHWFHLPLAMVADHWYDFNGVWSGSATILPDGRIIMLYTGSTNASVQVQNLAVPADLSDPLLVNWLKHDANPILVPPPGVGSTDFRDPTTAWYVPVESAWRIAIGSKDADHNGIALAYRTKDFVNYELLPGIVHSVAGTGMWECLDMYPVATTGLNGLDTSVNGPGVKHVLKASLDDNKHDYYAIGTYDVEANTWTPDDLEADVGIGLRLDYGKYYASKTFYDPVKQRRVLWGWTGETDSEVADIQKGWASLQTIPRTVRLDEKTKTNLLLWPVEEVEILRTRNKVFSNITIAAGSVVPLDVATATQVDILAEFEVAKESLEAIVEADVGYNCSTSGGSAGRGMLGPFGFLVLSDKNLSEQTAVYFYIAKGIDGKLDTFICHDELRSSKASDIVKRIYGNMVPVLEGEKLSVRIMVDHSIVETFGQGGRTCITSRIYPTKAIYGDARLFLFNNATGTEVTATSVKIWKMNPASIRPYSFDNQTKYQQY